MKKMMMHMQTLFLLFRFVPLRRNKVFWLAQAVPEEFTPLCSFVPYIYKDLRGAKHTLQCIQASFFSFGEPAEGEEQARAVKHCIVPMHKSNYVVVSDRNLLTGVNQKGGLVK
jgi:hypothetical protein